MENFEYSIDFFVINSRNYRLSLKLSQEKLADELTSMSGKSGRSNISQYETKEVSPPFDFVFELSQRMGVNLHDLFSKEIKFEHGKVSPGQVLREPTEPPPGYPPAKADTVDKLAETIRELVLKSNDLPALREEIERLKKRVAELEQKKGK